MSSIEEKTRHAILLVLGEARNLVTEVPLPPKHTLAAKFRFAAIGEGGFARQSLQAGHIDPAWAQALSSLQYARIAYNIHFYGPDPAEWL